MKKQRREQKLTQGRVQIKKIVEFSIDGRKQRISLFFSQDKDKDNILVDNILGIRVEDIFRQLILQRIRIKTVG